MLTRKLLLKNCKYSVSHANTCANVHSYVKCLFNVANTLVQSNSCVPNVNSCNTGHNELSPLLVRKTGVELDHHNVLPDLGYWDQPSKHCKRLKTFSKLVNVLNTKYKPKY